MSATKRKRASPSERYSAKLLFQLRFGNEETETPMRISEQRIVTLGAISPEDAYRQAVDHGKKRQESFRNEDGISVRLEFVGVMDLMHLGAEADENEVWYEIKRMRAPMERRTKLIPPKKELPVFQLATRPRRNKAS